MRRKYLELLFHLLVLGDDGDLGVPHRKRRRRDSGTNSLDALIDELLQLSTISRPLERQDTHSLRLETMSDEQCIRMCRFERAHLAELAELLLLPEAIITRYGTRCHRNVALPLFLYRLASGTPWYHMERDFLPRQTSGREIFHYVLEHIWQLFHHLLTGSNAVTNQEELLRSADAISAKLRLSQRVVMAFIDGKLYQVCKPVFGQESIFNGKDRIHALKYQAILHACGLLMNFAGPYEGRRHDAFVWAESDFLALLEQVLPDIELALFGDSAYPRSVRMLKPFVGKHLSSFQHAFNDRWCSGAFVCDVFRSN